MAAGTDKTPRGQGGSLGFSEVEDFVQKDVLAWVQRNLYV